MAPKQFWVLAVAGVVLAVVVLAIGYTAEKIKPIRAAAARCRSIPISNGEANFVGVVGDSWTTQDRFDAGILAQLNRIGLAGRVVSSGISGAKTGEIATELPPVIDAAMAFKAGRRFVVIEGGINDKSSFFGADYYAANVQGMVNAALRCGVYPIVLTIPPFHRKAPEGLRQFVFIELNRLVSMDWREDTTLYSDALRGRLRRQVAAGDVAIVDARTLVSESEIATRYVDGVHLTPAEFRVFALGLGKAVAVFVASKK